MSCHPSHTESVERCLRGPKAAINCKPNFCHLILFPRLYQQKTHFLGTNPDPGSVSTTSVQNKQPPAPNASNQNNQSTQTGVKKFSSPKRTPTRHSAAKDLSVWRQACFIMAPKTGSKKLRETQLLRWT